MAKKKEKKERLKAELRRGTLTRSELEQQREAKAEKQRAKEERRQEKWSAKIASKLNLETGGDTAAGEKRRSSSKRAQGILAAQRAAMERKVRSMSKK